MNYNLLIQAQAFAEADSKSAAGVSVEVQNKRARMAFSPPAGISILTWHEVEGQHISLAFVEHQAFQSPKVRLDLRFSKAVGSIRVLPDEAGNCL